MPNPQISNDDDEWEKVPSTATATAPADDDEWEKVAAPRAAPTPRATPVTTKELPGAGPTTLKAVNEGRVPFVPPTKTEIENPQHPDYYGFTPVNMLQHGIKGIGNVLKFGAGVAKDISDPNRPLFFGGAEEGPQESTFHKYVIHPSETELEKAENAPTTLERYGHAGAALLPMIGPYAAGRTEEAAKTGNIGGAVAETAGELGAAKLGEAGVGKLADIGTKAVTTGAPAAGEFLARTRGLGTRVGGEPIVDTAQDIIGELAKQDPDVAAQKAVGLTGKSKKAIRFQDNLAGARPYLEGATSLADLQQRIVGGLKEVWKPYSDALDKIGDREVEGPDGLTTLNKLEEKRLELSAERQKLQQLMPTDRATALQKDADLRANEQRYKAYQNVIDHELNSAGVDGRTIRRVFGQLKGIQKLIEGRNTLTEAERAYGLGRIMEDFHITKPLRSFKEGVVPGVQDILAGRPTFKGKPTDVAVAEAFRPGTGGPKPDLTAKAPGPQYAQPAGPLAPQYAEPLGPIRPPGNFELENLAPNRGALWQQQIGEPPALETGAPTPGRAIEPIGPQPAPREPLAPITGEQLPLNLPGGQHELFNLPQTPTVGTPRALPEGIAGLLPEPRATELPPPGTAELAHPEMFPRPAGSVGALSHIFRRPAGKPGAGQMARGFTGEMPERIVGHTAEGGPIREGEAPEAREVGGAGREGVLQPIRTTPAEKLTVGDTFVDEKGDPRRITDIADDGTIKTADHTLRDYKEGEIKHLGEINSPKAQLARGGMFHAPTEIGEGEPERFDLGEIGGEEKAGEKVKPMTPPGRVFRAQNVGETEMNPETHAHATASLEEAQRYAEGRGAVEGKPQEIRSVDLSKLKPEEYSTFKGPNGNDWVKFNRQLEPHELEPVEAPAEKPEIKEVPETHKHLTLDIFKNLQPDEIEFLKDRPALQKNVVKEYDKIDPTIREATEVAKAGHGLGGWWRRFIDAFEAMGDTKSEDEIQRLGPDHAEALKALHSALSGNKAVEHANKLAWNAYRDWLDEGRPRDRESINKIIAQNGKPKGVAAISDTIKDGKVVNEGLDTTKMYKLVNSPQFRDVAPEPFHGHAFVGSPAEGVSPGAKKIPSMLATVANEGNLSRVVFDTHMKDLYGQNGLTDAKYIADSVHIRQAAKEMGIEAGEAQEQMWGTVLGLKYLMGREGMSPAQAAKMFGNETLATIGKDYAQIMLDAMEKDPDFKATLDGLKKHGFDPGGPVAVEKLRGIVEQGKARMAEQPPEVNRRILGRAAKRIAGQMASMKEE